MIQPMRTVIRHPDNVAASAANVQSARGRIQHGQRPMPVLAWLLAGLVLLAAGCSLSLTYRHADWLILWELDQHFDLTADQKEALGQNLKTVLARHRTEALPGYETFLVQFRERVRAGLTREDVDWVFVTYQRLRADLFERIVGDGAVFLASVDEHQVRHLEQAFQNDMQKAERLLKASADERLSKRAAETVDFVGDWLGPLTAEQKHRVTEMSRALPDLQGPWLDRQKHMREELVQALRSRQSQEVLVQRLRDWLVFSERSAPPAYQYSLEHTRAAVKQMVLAVDRMATPQQRAHALAKLQALIHTIHELSVS